MGFKDKHGVEVDKYKLNSYLGLIDEQVIDIRAKESLRVEFVREYLELEHAMFVENDNIINELIKEL